MFHSVIHSVNQRVYVYSQPGSGLGVCRMYRVHLFAHAAIIEYHTSGGLNNRNLLLMVLETEV